MCTVHLPILLCTILSTCCYRHKIDPIKFPHGPLGLGFGLNGVGSNLGWDGIRFPWYDNCDHKYCFITVYGKISWFILINNKNYGLFKDKIVVYGTFLNSYAFTCWK